MLKFASRHALLLIVTLGAALRFSTLGLQSFWFDEQATLTLAHIGLLDMLRALPVTESSPPLYYLLQWAWDRLFGSGEVAVRSLSAVLGTATVPVLYAATRQLASSRRAGLIAAAFAATGPMLIWYSQEARTYALFLFLAAVSFGCFARALDDRGPGWLWAWALTSALTLTTHYFAVFLFVPQLAWLFARRSGSRLEVAGAAGVIAVVSVPLLAAYAGESDNAPWIKGYSLWGRLAQLPQHLLAGMEAPWAALPVVALALVALVAGLLLASRSARPPQTAARRAIVISLSLLAGGLVLALLVGRDYILSRNLIGLWIPFAVALATILAGSARRWIGAAAAVALCGLGIALSVWTALTPAAQRPDYGELADAIGPATRPRLVVSQPGYSQPLVSYLESTSQDLDPRPSTRELVVISLRPERSYAVGTCWWVALCGGRDLDPQAPFEVPQGFVETGSGSTQTFDYRVYRAARPIEITRPPEVTPRVFMQTP